MSEKIIIKCKECQQKLRIPLFKTKKLSVKCPKCATQVLFDSNKYRAHRNFVKWSLNLQIVFFLLASILCPFLLMDNYDANASRLKDEYKQKITRIESEFSNDRVAIKSSHDTEVAKIDKQSLRRKAKTYYEKIWHERENYNSRYALTAREKAILEMLALAKDKTKTAKEIIESIAKKAAPRNSEVIACSTSEGTCLNVTFDMKELTSGEVGTRTKHLTIDSLKKEVVRLISKVAYDVFEFCRDIDLESISIGCKHFVNQKREYGKSKEENIVLYQVELSRKNIEELEHNSFLNSYSVTQYFTVDVNNFPSIRITRENANE